MGLSIGAASRAIAQIAPAGPIRPERYVAPIREAEYRGQLVRPEAPPEVRAGFGENTLSPSSAALKTLDANLEAAARLVPSVEELRDRARAAQAERANAAASRAEADRSEGLRRRESVRPEPNPSARFFVQDTEEPTRAGVAPTEVDENSPEAEPPAPAPSGTRLDVQA